MRRYLDVPVDADLGMIELAFRRQMRELGSGEIHKIRRQKLQEAYDVLADPDSYIILGGSCTLLFMYRDPFERHNF